MRSRRGAERQSGAAGAASAILNHKGVAVGQPFSAALFRRRVLMVDFDFYPGVGR